MGVHSGPKALRHKIRMRSVKGKPFKRAAWQLNALTVLICPVNFPTSSTFLHVLNATREQVTESASELTEQARQVSRDSLGWFNGDDGSTVEVLTAPTEHFTTQQVRDGGLGTADWMFYGGETIAFVIIVFALGCKLYKMLFPREEGIVGDQPIDLDMSPLRGGAVPCPWEPPSYSDSPPPYEAPPSYDSIWLGQKGQNVGPNTADDSN
eukprot:Blabericola_migrator_1__5090@NODE_2633_length_2510_cov_96_866148_g1652_i0_p2_GENE_NODE_2633_length_2510_cov_96_866148_g1652_i0NODE_2633_length_2510_cov_96_866148_g1652_i0_p2_ORF_typecomplete_len209_score25_04DUF4853/PF16145_5/0_018_NODE_2633_length_2510_cov_96_866148_g1652_i012921918